MDSFPPDGNRALQLDCSHSARPVAILFESLTPYRRGALAHLRLEVGSQRNAFARRALTSSSTRNSVQPISIQAIVADGRPAVCGSARRAQTYQMPRVRRGWAVGRASWPSGTHLRVGFGMLPTRKRGAQNRPRINRISARRPRMAPVRVDPRSPATRGERWPKIRQTLGVIPTSIFGHPRHDIARRESRSLCSVLFA